MSHGLASDRGPLLVVARALGAAHLLLAVGLVAGLWLALPARALPVLGRPDVHSVVWPLVPVVLAAVVSVTASNVGRDLERLAARSAFLLRLAFLALVCSGAAAVIVLGWQRSPAVVSRNTAALVGLGLLAVVLLPQGWGWVPIVLTPMTMWLLGVRVGGEAYPWAVLLRPGSDEAAGLASIVVVVVGVCAWCAVGPRCYRS